jgi:hypothetical protein
MDTHHVAIGIVLLVSTLGVLGGLYRRARKLDLIAFWGWGGLAIILSAEALLILRVAWVTSFFTPIAWTGYLLFMDGLVWSLKRESRLGRTPGQFLVCAFWSVPLWLVFEVYNLRLKNWTYVGLSENPWVGILGSIWSFATIWPAIFETADFVAALGLLRCGEHDGARTASKRESPDWRGHDAISSSTRVAFFVLGLVMVVVPVIVPARIGAYLFGLVWIGFIPLLEPITYSWKGRSLLRDYERGSLGMLHSLLISGWVCGILWEFWNYWASTKWLYIFPIMQRWKIFEMPVLGYLGFPVFAVECYVMYEFLRTVNSRIFPGRNRQHATPVSSRKGEVARSVRSRTSR